MSRTDGTELCKRSCLALLTLCGSEDWLLWSTESVIGSSGRRYATACLPRRHSLPECSRETEAAAHARAPATG